MASRAFIKASQERHHSTLSQPSVRQLKAWLEVPVNDSQILHLAGFEARNNGTQNPSPNKAYDPLNLPFHSTALFMARQRHKVPKTELRAPNQEKSPSPSPENPKASQNGVREPSSRLPKNGTIALCLKWGDSSKPAQVPVWLPFCIRAGLKPAQWHQNPSPNTGITSPESATPPPVYGKTKTQGSKTELRAPNQEKSPTLRSRIPRFSCSPETSVSKPRH
ncbi:hypothetical protein Nepgr_007385 [Nepenthes gracilis]|uniref:Uncharacterized protein n=1 Tax=Nepenthes gracilis TaxID=150966 RepID=A0AAD3S6V8_NEPGR|nr:hypothetical protein Nepgr_007385 [Nepenthes gracilis]